MGNISYIRAARPGVLEFFAGIGLARSGLEEAGFRVLWANDYEAKKKALYDSHFADSGNIPFALEDIGKLAGSELPRGASLAWASSPCTDLSLAGDRAGLGGRESGTFWHFVRILDELGVERPEVVVVENVVGLASSHGGEDLAAAIRGLNRLGYSVDVLTIDARRFVPQSRPRLFIVGALNPPVDCHDEESELRPSWLQWVFTDAELVTHRAGIPSPPPLLTEGLSEQVEEIGANDDRWWDEARTEAFIESLSQIQLERVERLRDLTITSFRTAYRRTRKGKAVWEVRRDDISGCLRTAKGGSSKQAVVKLGKGTIRVRWMTPVEYSRLMGAGEYNLGTARASDLLFGFGDAVAVPAVRWLGENYLLPLVEGRSFEGTCAQEPMFPELVDLRIAHG